jgi:RecA-family ATPase
MSKKQIKIISNNEVIVPVNTIRKVNKSSYITTAKELLDMKLESIPFLLEPIFPKIGLAALCGSSDNGKSTLLRQFSAAIVNDEKEFLGFKLNAIHKDVIYVSSEDDEFAMAALLYKQFGELKQKENFINLRYIFETDDLLKKLEETLLLKKADCIIIDAFSDIIQGDLNANNAVRSFLNEYANLAKKHGCLIIFLHHTSKKSEGLPPAKGNLIGSQGFEAKMRVVVELRKDNNDRYHKHICIVKGNYIEETYKNDSFVIKFNKNMMFTKTNLRVNFSKLVPFDSRTNSNNIRDQRILELHNAGKSSREIERILKNEGIPVSKSTIANIKKSCPTVQSVKGDGQLDSNLEEQVLEFSDELEELDDELELNDKLDLYGELDED